MNYPLTLYAIPNTDLPLAIEAYSNKKELLFTVYADGKATVAGNIDIYIEEVKIIQVIAENFYLFYNNIKTAK